MCKNVALEYGVYLGFGQTHNRLVWAPGAQTQLVHCPNWPIGAGMQHLGAIGCPTGGPGLGPSVPNPPPLWQNLVDLALAAFGGHATLMAMAQDHAHGLCTTHKRHSVPLGA